MHTQTLVNAKSMVVQLVSAQKPVKTDIHAKLGSVLEGVCVLKDFTDHAMNSPVSCKLVLRPIMLVKVSVSTNKTPGQSQGS